MIQTFDSPLVVENPAEVLRNEDGIFEVTSPYGHVFSVVCRPGVQMNVREISQSEINVMPARAVWQIKRIRTAAATAA
jgi:hypothetical protein